MLSPSYRFLLLVVSDGWLSLRQPAHAGSPLVDSSTLKMEAIRSSETSVNARSTQRHIPECDVHQGWCSSETSAAFHWITRPYMCQDGRAVTFSLQAVWQISSTSSNMAVWESSCSICCVVSTTGTDAFFAKLFLSRCWNVYCKCILLSSYLHDPVFRITLLFLVACIRYHNVLLSV
jgi:hypothetical protein